MRKFYFFHFVFIALMLAMRVQAQTPVSPASTASDNSVLERETFALINQYRKADDLPVFAWDADIAKVARLHSRDMAQGAVDFGHGGFDERVDCLRRLLLGLAGCGENVLMTDDPLDAARHAVASWLKSAPHRHNIRGDYNRSGIGIWRSDEGTIYFTQIFVRLRPSGEEAMTDY